MTRGRKPNPTAIKQLLNNPGKRPFNDNEPVLPCHDLVPPDVLIPEAREEWDRVVSSVVASGLVTVADLAAFAIYCTAYGRWVQAERLLAIDAAASPRTEGLTIETPNGAVIQNPLLGVRNKALGDLKAAAAELGMTPSARSRVQAKAPDKADPAADFFN